MAKGFFYNSSMNTREYLKTIEEFSKPKPRSNKAQPFGAPEIKDWAGRKIIKNSIFIKYSKILGCVALASLILIALPLFAVYPPYGKVFLLSVPPTIIIAFSWMLGCWWAWDKDNGLFYAVTVGAMPARGVIYFGWVWLADTIPGLNVIVMAVAMMFHWILFVIPEIIMFVEFSNKFPRSANITEP
jgi:hypothetical protein